MFAHIQVELFLHCWFQALSPISIFSYLNSRLHNIRLPHLIYLWVVLVRLSEIVQNNWNVLLMSLIQYLALIRSLSLLKESISLLISVLIFLGCFGLFIKLFKFIFWINHINFLLRKKIFFSKYLHLRSRVNWLFASLHLNLLVFQSQLYVIIVLIFFFFKNDVTFLVSFYHFLKICLQHFDLFLKSFIFIGFFFQFELVLLNNFVFA